MAAVNLRHIEIFHAVMTAGSLTEAAHLLHTSQPTVSRELARFEKVIGLKLFERVRGRLHPTVQGLRLFEEVQRSWYGLDRIVSAASVCAMVRAGVGVSVVNPLTALDYAASGLVVRRFSIAVPFTVSLIRPLHRPSSALVQAFSEHLQAGLPKLVTSLDAILSSATTA